MTATLPMDVLTGLPEPTRGRWQPLRAGILNLFRYDEQTFAFHHGRLLIRGHNGSGKSMALEVLLPFVLDADLTPSKLSTFGGRDRNMRLWLLDYDKTGTRTNERAYVWVEFGRRHLDGTCEFFTAGAMLEGTRSTDVKPTYFTTAARLGRDLTVGGPGREPLNKNLLTALLAEQSDLGRPGKVHPDAKEHRKAVNDALYQLEPKRFDALRMTLRQLRRPKLSDKLDESGLDEILRQSLPPVADATVADLAEGFERLDRHAAAVTELEGTIKHLRALREVYRKYAAVAAAARADGVAAAETAIDQVRERITAAQAADAAAQAELDRITTRRTAIGLRLGEITGRSEALQEREAFKKGQDLEPQRRLVAKLAETAKRTTERRRRDEQTASRDTQAAERAAGTAAAAVEAALEARMPAAGAAGAAHTSHLDTDLVAALEQLRELDIPDAATLDAAVSEARGLLGVLTHRLRTWEDHVDGLQRLDTTTRAKAAAAEVARTETERAETEVETVEGHLNDRLQDERQAMLAWLDELTSWAEDAVQLAAGQAPPLPWEPDTAAERARRWATEAATSRTRVLLADHDALTTAAGDRSSAADRAGRVAADLQGLAGLVAAAADLAADYRRAIEAYRAELTQWASDTTELRHGQATPDWTEPAPDQLATRAHAWADAAATARTRTLLEEQGEIERAAGPLQARAEELTAQEERLADGGPPELPTPATRRADRAGRPGAPLFLLVEFAPGVDPADRLGIEAAALGSGLADAWVSPDGQLLSAEDGTPLLDTQLYATDLPDVGQSLADVLVPADTADVPLGLVAQLLARIGCAPTAPSGTGPGLTLGRDGSWRAGALTGAHTTATVVLIGAANREAHRLATLQAVRAELATVRSTLAELTARDAGLQTSLRRVAAERGSVPTDARLRAAAQDAATAAASVTTQAPTTRSAALAAAAALPAVATRNAQVEPGDVDAAGNEAAERLRDQCPALLDAVTAAPAAADHAAGVRTLTAAARTLAVAREDAGAALRAAAAGISAQIEATAAERAALPDDELVRTARADLAQAQSAAASARLRLQARESEEKEAQQFAATALAALRAALLGAGLPVGLDVPALATAVAAYRTAAERWLRAGVDVVGGTGAATLALARSLDSAEEAETARGEAEEAVNDHHREAARLRALTEDYGEDYAGIVAELSQLTEEQQALSGERDNKLAGEERTHWGAQSRAQADLAAATEARAIADQTRAVAQEAFLAAARLGLLIAAGMPETAPAADGQRPGEPTDGGETPDAVLGVRAVRTWARAVRESAGDRLVRDRDAVEQATNRVTDTRYHLEPYLAAGQVSIREEQQSSLLVLHASRGGDSLPLVQMMEVLTADLERDQRLLAVEEADLFRKFLADDTRREVTTKVRDARTQVAEMARLMSDHPTGSGLRVRLQWVPDERNAPGMQDIVKLMGRDAPLESEKDRLQEFFRARVAQVRASATIDYKAQLAELLDYRQWWRFVVEYRRRTDTGWTQLTSKEHGSLSGGEKAVCLHLPLFAAAASYCDSAPLRATELDGGTSPGAPRLILLDEVFAGVDEDNRGELFDLIRDLDLDLVATSESEKGLYPQIDGLAIYQLFASDTAVLASRSLWDGRTELHMLDEDLLRDHGDDPDLFP